MASSESRQVAPQNEQASPLVVEPETGHAGDLDADSAYGDELSTYTASITSTIYNYPSQHGRTYHAFRAGRYTLPNDEAELDRLDIHHHLIVRAMKDRLYYAPILADFGGRVLDLATGNGIWSIHFGDTHPAATVIGNDLAPTQPTMVPPNVSFYVDDIESEWNYSGAEAFDFIHARFLAGAVGDWPALLRNCFAHTKAGGYVEFQDWNTWLYSENGTLPADSALNKFHQIASGGRHAQGYNMRPGEDLYGYFKGAGFVDLSVTKLRLPLGPWPKDPHLKEIGTVNLMQMDRAIEGICLGVLTQLPEEAGGPWSYEEIQVFLAAIRKDMRNRRINGLYDFYVVWGRKPAD